MEEATSFPGVNGRGEHTEKLKMKREICKQTFKKPIVNNGMMEAGKH